MKRKKPDGFPKWLPCLGTCKPHLMLSKHAGDRICKRGREQLIRERLQHATKRDKQ